MARFGLLMLNRGKWENEVILDQAFFDDATQSSQALNQAYGYMWWLNGKQSYMLPQSQFTFTGSLVPAGPGDMVMALGKNDSKDADSDAEQQDRRMDVLAERTYRYPADDTQDAAREIDMKRLKPLCRL